MTGILTFVYAVGVGLYVLYNTMRNATKEIQHLLESFEISYSQVRKFGEKIEFNRFRIESHREGSHEFSREFEQLYRMLMRVKKQFDEVAEDLGRSNLMKYRGGRVTGRGRVTKLKIGGTWAFKQGDITEKLRKTQSLLGEVQLAILDL